MFEVSFTFKRSSVSFWYWSYSALTHRRKKHSNANSVFIVPKINIGVNNINNKCYCKVQTLFVYIFYIFCVFGVFSIFKKILEFFSRNFLEFFFLNFFSRIFGENFKSLAHKMAELLG